MPRMLHVGWPLMLLCLGVVACDDPVQVGSGLEGNAAGAAEAAPDPAPAAGEAPPAAAEGAEGEGEGTDDGGMLSYDDDDFVESERNRDPFRNYATMFRVRALETPQRAVVMPTTSIEQMRLMAIISGVARPRAMLVDPSSVGHVVARGDFIGRPEVVQTGGVDSAPLQLNWRVDRIRASEVVLTREDPTAPGRVPLSRVIPLYDEEDRVRDGLTFSGQQGRAAPQTAGTSEN